MAILAGLARAFDRLVRLCANASLVFAAILTLALCALGSADVIGSRFFGTAVPSAFELQEVTMGTIVFAGLAAVQLNGKHIVVDILTVRATGCVRYVLDLLAIAASTTLFVTLTWQGWLLAQRSLAVRELSPGFVAFPLYLIKLLAFGFLTIALATCVCQLLRHLAKPFVRA